MDQIIFGFTPRPFWGALLILGIFVCTALVFAVLPKADDKRPTLIKLRDNLGLSMLPPALFVFVTLLWTTAEQGLMIGLLNKDVEGLGAERIIELQETDESDQQQTTTIVQPNIEILLGVILALG
ncbi:MAG: hypothetical protein ACI9KK_000373 [Ascidiaceihabitans sp.]